MIDLTVNVLVTNKGFTALEYDVSGCGAFDLLGKIIEVGIKMMKPCPPVAWIAYAQAEKLETEMSFKYFDDKFECNLKFVFRRAVE